MLYFASKYVFLWLLRFTIKIHICKYKDEGSFIECTILNVRLK